MELDESNKRHPSHLNHRPNPILTCPKSSPAIFLLLILIALSLLSLLLSLGVEYNDVNDIEGIVLSDFIKLNDVVIDGLSFINPIRPINVFLVIILIVLYDDAYNIIMLNIINVRSIILWTIIELWNDYWVQFGFFICWRKRRTGFLLRQTLTCNILTNLVK